MFIIMGLGNPGEEFVGTRHNAGFMVVDFFAQKNQFPEFSPKKLWEALVSEKEHILLVKPQTYMNESGRTAKRVAKLYSINKHSLVVIHDDMDLPLGTFKVAKGRGSAGHKGVESIIKAVGKENLVRLRVGIRPPAVANGKKPKNPETFVVKKFTKEEVEILKPTIKKITEALEYFQINDLEKTMGAYN